MLEARVQRDRLPGRPEDSLWYVPKDRGGAPPHKNNLIGSATGGVSKLAPLKTTNTALNRSLCLLSPHRASVFLSGACVRVCVFGGGVGRDHRTADDWCVCERGVSENVMIGLVVFTGVHTQAYAQSHSCTLQ